MVNNMQNKEEQIFNEKLSENLNQKIKIELNQLISELHASDCPSKQQIKKTRYLVMDALSNKNYGGLFSTIFFQTLCLIYRNKDNKLESLHKMYFSNKNNKILLGANKEVLKKTISESQYNQLTTNNFKQKFYCIVDFSAIKTNDSNLNNIINKILFQFQSNKSVFNIDVVESQEYLFFNDKISDLLKSNFNQIINPICENNNVDVKNIENIFDLEYIVTNNKIKEDTLRYFFNLNSDELADIFQIKNENDFIDLLSKEDFNFDEINIDDKSNKLFVCNNQLDFTNIHSLLNNYGEFGFNFLLSPYVQKKSFSLSMPPGIPIYTKVKIISNEYLNMELSETIVSKLNYQCPGCKQIVLLDPNDIGADIYHACDPITKTRTKIKPNIIRPYNQNQITLYKVGICSNYEDVINNNTKENWVSDVYVYSFDNNIQPGIYFANLIKFYDSINILKKKSTADYFYLLLSKQRVKIKFSEEKIIKDNKEIEKIINNLDLEKTPNNQFLHLQNKIYEKQKLPKHKLWDILFSIRQYYKDRFDIDIDDNGLFLQLVSLISIIARQAFQENKMAISVMGVGSISKTFPANMVFNITDMNYRYISDSTRLTTPGITGGVNTSATINGVVVKKFDRGAISNNGAVTFDECQSIFLRPDIQAVIKSIPQEEYDVSIIGGQKILFSCTPVFLSNFNEFMPTYEKKIIDAYITKYKSIYKFESERALKTNEDIVRYVSQLNLHQNIEYYYESLDDKILANVIYAVRKQYEASRVDWKTGSQLEAMNRILFDVAVHRKISPTEVNLAKDLLENENSEEINLFEPMPIQQITEEILKYIYKEKDLDKIILINLNNKMNNSSEVRQQIKKLQDSIHHFLTKEKLGINITTYFIQNVDNFDKKIRNLVFKTIMILQLINDIHATELSDDVKRFANILLLKCKRGLNQQEYNMELNVSEIKFYKNLSMTYLSDLEDTKVEMYYEQKREQDIEKLQKELEEKYILEKKQKDADNSLKELSIDLNDVTIKPTEQKNEFTFDEICQRYCPGRLDEDAKEYIKKLKKDGIIYEPRSGVYKTTTSNGGLDE